MHSCPLCLVTIFREESPSLESRSAHSNGARGRARFVQLSIGQNTYERVSHKLSPWFLATKLVGFDFEASTAKRQRSNRASKSREAHISARRQTKSHAHEPEPKATRGLNSLKISAERPNVNYYKPITRLNLELALFNWYRSRPVRLFIHSFDGTVPSTPRARDTGDE